MQTAKVETVGGPWPSLKCLTAIVPARPAVRLSTRPTWPLPFASDISSGSGAAWLAFVRRGLASLGVRCDSLGRCCGAVTLAEVCPQALPAVQLSSLAALRQTGTGTGAGFRSNLADTK